MATRPQDLQFQSSMDNRSLEILKNFIKFTLQLPAEFDLAQIKLNAEARSLEISGYEEELEEVQQELTKLEQQRLALRRKQRLLEQKEKEPGQTLIQAKRNLLAEQEEWAEQKKIALNKKKSIEKKLANPVLYGEAIRDYKKFIKILEKIGKTYTESVPLLMQYNEEFIAPHYSNLQQKFLPTYNPYLNSLQENALAAYKDICRYENLAHEEGEYVEDFEAIYWGAVNQHEDLLLCLEAITEGLDSSEEPEQEEFERIETLHQETLEDLCTLEYYFQKFEVNASYREACSYELLVCQKGVYSEDYEDVYEDAIQKHQDLLAHLAAMLHPNRSLSPIVRQQMSELHKETSANLDTLENCLQRYRKKSEAIPDQTPESSENEDVLEDTTCGICSQSPRSGSDVQEESTPEFPTFKSWEYSTASCSTPDSQEESLSLSEGYRHDSPLAPVADTTKEIHSDGLALRSGSAFSFLFNGSQQPICSEVSEVGSLTLPSQNL